MDFPPAGRGGCFNCMCSSFTVESLYSLGACTRIGLYLFKPIHAARPLTRPRTALRRETLPATTAMDFLLIMSITITGQGHLSRECQEPAKEKSCYRCGQTGHLSRECPQGGDSNYGGSQECYKCGQVGHIARNCSQGGNYGGYSAGGYGGFGGAGGAGGRQQTCYSCGGFGHMARDCTQGQKCYNCGEVGHVSRDCPTEAKGERMCYKCKQPGHVQSACPN
ncbi:unnamed protein product [Penicillium nalgiovense]|nr:unnamed protein product [Penicillium nalgiovense]CAG7957716.1 unnamed protein product [Penicillium nalgiovense]CAG7959154.1 unnamed protein product [Penicillium nalgiovense]CAG7977562.1 unnamed protein product [Penicillium nalgiovense]CAG8028013.1 unnamed protein product [Penicillium nalgiovense]